MAITFSFKKVKEEEVEQYNFPVLTQCPKDDTKGSVAKFRLNKALFDLLGTPTSISIGQNDDGGIVLVNTSDALTPHQSHVNADNSINSKFLMSQLSKKFCTKSDELITFNVKDSNEADMYAVDIIGWFNGVDNDIDIPVTETEEVVQDEFSDLERNFMSFEGFEEQLEDETILTF